MIDEPRCFLRECTHFLGILQIEETEESEVPYCEAFPKGIPYEISYGEDNHSDVHPRQKNNIVYERRRSR